MSMPATERRPPWFDPSMPAREACVLPSLLAGRAAQTPDRDYLEFEDGRRWTYGEAYAQARRAASALRRLGVKPGDRVLVWLPNGPENVLAWFGANLAGACFVPINIAYRGRLLAHVIQQSGARVLIAHAGLVERLQDIEVAALDTLVVVGAPGGEVRWKGKLQNDSILAGPDDGLPDSQPEIWDAQMMIFTSGTTGPSKGVLCTYLQIHTVSRVQYGYMTPDDRMMIELPMFHIGGVSGVLGVLVAGSSGVLFESFNTAKFWDRIRRHRATTTGGMIGSMPSFLSTLPASPQDREHTLRFTIIPLTKEAIALARRHGFDYSSGFNMTELSCPLFADVNTEALGSCGRPRSGCECRIVDANDIECPPGVTGELVVRCDLPWVTSIGYEGQHEANARAWRNGWFHTGDLLYRNEAGDFFFVDRLKDAIRRRGENVSSVEVESEVYAFPGVGEVAAVGVPSESGEEEILVAVAPVAGGAPIDAEALVRFLIPRVTHFMVPRYVRVMSSLPKTPTNKIMKVEIRREGITADTWDRSAHGIEVRRTKL